MKIDQLAFIKDLIVQKRLIKCNPNVIPMKTSSAINISKVKDYKKTDI